MASYREEEDPFEEDIVFDQAGLLNSSSKRNSAIRRVSSGKCGLFSKTLGLCGAFFGLGLCIAIPGPTFLSPSMTLQADVSPVSSIYAARSCGYLMGAIIGGFLFDHFNRLFLLFISLLLTSVFIIVVPWCQIFWLLQACMVLLGISMGFLDTGGNVLCLDLWGRNSAPFMQALHFSFGLGAFVAPLLAAPFLQSPLMPNHVTNSLSQFPQVPKNLDQQHPFGFHSFRNKREDEVLLKSAHMLSKTIENVTSDINIFNVSQNSLTSDKMSFSTELTSTTHMTIVSQTTQRVPKPKPSKTDGSKLGPENWDRIHVGKPPLSDLILPSTTTATTPLATNPSTLPADSSTQQMLDSSPIPASQIQPEEITLMSTTTVEKSSFAESATTANILRYSTLSTVNITANFIEKSNITLAEDLVTDIHQTSEAFAQLSTVSNDVELHSMKKSSKANDAVEPGVDTDNNEPVYNQDADIDNEETVYAEETNVSNEHNEPTYIQEPVVDAGKDEPVESIFARGDSAENDYENELKQEPVIPDSSFSEESRKVEYEQTTPHVIPLPTEVILQTLATTPRHVHHLKPGTYDNDTEDINSIFNMFASGIEKYGLTKIQFTYLIVGLFVFVISLVFLGFLCHNPRDPKSKQEEGQGSKKVISPSMSASFVCLMSIFLLLYVGLEVTYGQMVIAYSVHSDLQLLQSTGSVLAAVFWGTFSITRFASIFSSSGLSPISMMLFNCALCTTGTIVLSSMGNRFEWALWLGTILLAVGLASIFPTSILWIERYIHVTNKVAAVFVIAVTLGQMICPIIIYHLMVLHPTMLMHSSLVINILCIFFFVIMWKLASKLGEKYCVVNNNGYQLANQNEEEDDLIEMSPSHNRLSLTRHSLASEHRSLLNGNSTQLP